MARVRVGAGAEGLQYLGPEPRESAAAALEEEGCGARQ